MGRKFTKNAIAFGSGAAVGITTNILLKQYADQYGTIPFLDQFLPLDWAKWSSTGAILLGGLTTLFSLKTKSLDLSRFLSTFGITNLVGGLLNGIFPNGAAARAAAAKARLAQLRRPIARNLAQRRPIRTVSRVPKPPTSSVAPETRTGIPTQVIYS